MAQSTIAIICSREAPCPSPLARSRRSLAAENLFLRKQLALYLERNVKPARAVEL